MFNETRSTMQDDVKNQVRNEFLIELEIDHQENDNAAIQSADEETRQLGRNRHPPSRYGGWVYIAQEEDPITVKQTLSSPDAEK